VVPGSSPGGPTENKGVTTFKSCNPFFVARFLQATGDDPVTSGHILTLGPSNFGGGFKESESAQRTLAGIEIFNIIIKDQIEDSKSYWFAKFKSLASLNQSKSATYTSRKS
jgi:hypothetical protein